MCGVMTDDGGSGGWREVIKSQITTAGKTGEDRQTERRKERN